jgi:dihydrofolate reductase
MSAPKITLVVARGRNNVIGRGGALPWRLPSDLKRFKARTMGRPVLMGRKTWDSLKLQPLPGRANIVVTRDARSRASGAFFYSDLAVALAAASAIAARSGAGEVCVIGGADIFAATLPLANRLVLTEVDLSPDGDVHFPPFDEREWREIAQDEIPRGPSDDAPFVVRTLERA